MCFDFPNNFVIDSHVVVHSAVSESSNFVPVNIGMLIYENFRYTIGGFSKDFKVSNDRIYVFSWDRNAENVMSPQY